LTDSGDSKESPSLDIDSLVEEAVTTTNTAVVEEEEEEVNGVHNDQIIEDEEELDEQSLMDIDMMKMAIQMAQSR
jgi:hypothetical protein